MSRAVVFTEYGSPEVLHVIEAGTPEPGAGQALVHVRAAGVQPFDSLFRSGSAHQWVPAKFPQRLGNDFAGVIEALGPDTPGFAPGDEVLGWAMFACYAEHVIAGVDAMVPKPEGMPWEHAGVLPASGLTAAAALDVLGVAEGETVLIHAAAGGVGSFAVQLAVAAGATVIGTASERNHDYVCSLGAIPVRYGDGLTGRVRAVAPEGVDAALDASGTIEALQASVELVRDRGRAGTVAYQPAADQLGVRRLSTQRSTSTLGRIVDLYTAGRLTASIQQEYPLERAADAHRALDTGHVRGKLVLKV